MTKERSQGSVLYSVPPHSLPYMVYFFHIVVDITINMEEKQRGNKYDVGHCNRFFLYPAHPVGRDGLLFFAEKNHGESI